MYRRARDLYALAQCSLVHMQAIIAVAAKRRDERRMHIDDAVFKFAAEALVQHGHEARQYNKLHTLFMQEPRQRGAVFPAGCIVPLFHDIARNACISGALQCIRRFIGRNDCAHAAVFDFTARLRIQNRL